MDITININAPELVQSLNRIASGLGNQGMIAGFDPANGSDKTFINGAQQPPTQAPVQHQTQPQQQPPQAVPTAPTQAPQQPVQQQQAPTQGNVPTSTPEYTQEQLAVAATQLVDQGNREQLVQLLQSFGAQSLLQLPKEQYGAFATKLREMGAKL